MSDLDSEIADAAARLRALRYERQKIKRRAWQRAYYQRPYASGDRQETRGRKPASERNALVASLRRDGQSYEDIAKQFGVTRERIRQIINKTDPSLTGHSYFFGHPNNVGHCGFCGADLRLAARKRYGFCSVKHKTAARDAAKIAPLVEMRKTGATWAAIAKAAGIVRGSFSSWIAERAVKNWCAQAGVEFPRGETRGKYARTPETLAKLRASIRARKERQTEAAE